MSHIWMSHVTHIDESCHTCELVFVQTCVAASVRDTQFESVTHNVSAWTTMWVREQQCECVTHNVSSWNTWHTMWVRDTQFECTTQCECATHNVSAWHTIRVRDTHLECMAVAHNVSSRHKMWVRDTQCEFATHNVSTMACYNRALHLPLSVCRCHSLSAAVTLCLPLSLLLSLSLASDNVPQLPSMCQLHALQVLHAQMRKASD